MEGLCTDLFGVTAFGLAAAVFALGAVAAYIARPRQDGPQNLPEPIAFPGEGPEATSRIGHVVDLLTSQDQVTWLAMTISVTTQVLLVGFAAGTTDPLSSIRWIAVVGILSATFFMALITRSNQYMGYYMRLLRDGTRREEFRRPDGLFPIPGGALSYVLHVVLLIAWFVVALLVVRC